MSTVQERLYRLRNTTWLRWPYTHAIALYLAVRLCGVVILGLLGNQHEESLLDLLKSWDGDWYLSIAEHGYGAVPTRLVDAAGNHTPTTALAFFPLYPVLINLLSTSTGMAFDAAGLVISAVAGVAAACALYRIGRLLDGRHRVALLLVVLWAGAPMAITLSMTYTEALFTALAAWALVGLVEQRWLLAGLCCLSAGLSRPSASVLVAVVGVTALIALFTADRIPWRAAACAVLCPLGLFGWWAYVGQQTGELGGWFDIEWTGWSTKFDGGPGTLKFVGNVLASGSSVMETVNMLIVLVVPILAVLTALGRVPWPITAYGAGMVVLVLGTVGIDFAKARFLLPAFPLLIPVARGLANRKPSTMIAATATFVLLGSWFSAYALTGWDYAI